jgi:fatty acid desaturase
MNPDLLATAPADTASRPAKSVLSGTATLSATDRRRLAQVEWRDLVALTPMDVAYELTLSLPWLAASLLLASRDWYVPALLASFLFFLTGLRQVHNAYHAALGLSRRSTDAVMFVLSILMLGSMHAIRINHLHHHRNCLGDDDVEAMSARLPAWGALLMGPWFPLRLHHRALQLARGTQRRWIIAELAANVAWCAFVFGASGSRVLQYHVVAMALGQCLTAFFAVWSVHHDTQDAPFPARTIRVPLKARISYTMFYHVEHHLFPAVPTRRLPTLAARLDRVAPEFARHAVF